jgi:uncharacterized protein
MSLQYFTSEKISPNRSLTPEGYLLCQNVPIARAGVMQYTRGELAEVEYDSDGMCSVLRPVEALHSDSTVASFIGKPVTLDHPREAVTPANFKRYAVGMAVKVWPGSGEHSNCLMADLLITEPAIINKLSANVIQISAGYRAETKSIGAGQAISGEMIGNHIALVEYGRCGDTCSIIDSATISRMKGKSMSDKPNLFTKLKLWMQDAEAEMEADPVMVEPKAETQTSDPGARLSAVEKAVNSMVERLIFLEEKMAKAPGKEEMAEAKDEDMVDPDEDKNEKPNGMVGDSAALFTAYRKVRQMAEILSPGIAVPAFTPTLSRKMTIDSLCEIRTASLKKAADSEAGRNILNSLVSDAASKLEKMSCVEKAALFKSAAVARGMLNDAVKPLVAPKEVRAATMTNAEQNLANKAFWNSKKGVK